MKKIYKLFFLLVLLELNMGGLLAQGPSWEGSGTQADPYKIETAADLVSLANEVNAGNDFDGVYFRLTKPIDLSSVCGEEVGDPAEEISWTPIGKLGRPFCGVFDGDSKTISNLYINDFGAHGLGLFGVVSGSAQLLNLNVVDYYIYCGKNGQYLGGLCGSIRDAVNCIVYNCHCSGTILGGADIGVLCGHVENTSVEACTSAGVVKVGSAKAGGLIGWGVKSTLKDCINYAAVTYLDETSGAANIGGICGEAVGVNFIDCKNSGNIGYCDNDWACMMIGGIAGRVAKHQIQLNPAVYEDLPSSFTSCENTGKIIGAGMVGGVFGQGISSVEMTLCTNSGDIEGFSSSGGLFGGITEEEGTIASSTNSGSVTGLDISLLNPAYLDYIKDYVAFGGIGALGVLVSVTGCTNSGEIEGVQFVGGICGKLKDSEVTACQNSGAVTGNYAGGIVGDGEIIEVANCTNLGEIDGAQSVGGITGTLASGTISSSFNTGDIEFNGSGAATVGGGIVGFVGSLSPDAVGSTIQYCYNMGNIKSNSISESERVLLGGIVGMLQEEGSAISNCYNSGVLSSVEVSEGVTVCIGGIISYISNHGAVSLTNSYNVGNFVYPNATILVLGGVVAAVEGEISISNCFYDKQMCPVVNEFCPDADGTPLLTSAMTNGSWIPGGSAFTVSNGLYPQLTVFATSPATAFDQAASIVSVTPAFLQNEENVEGVVTSPFTVGTGNGVSWSAVSPFSYDEGEVSFSTEGTGTLTVSKTVSDITVSKDIIMTTIIEDVCWDGSGTEADPYRIEDAAGLVCLAEKVNAGNSYAGVYFKMMNDIDLSSVCGESVGNWTPIGRATPFRGYFDGGNHTITGLYINGYDDYQGLFGIIADGAQVNNLTLGESTISGKSRVGLVGMMDVDSGSTVPSINHCTTLSSVNITGFQFVGGICGLSQGSFSYCINNATIVGNREVSNLEDAFQLTCTGGIVGGCIPYDYEDSDATGDYAITMTYCTNNGSVTTAAFGEYYAIAVGGIGGLIQGAVLTNCTNTAPVTGTAVIGGISGGTDGNDVYPSKFINCSNSGAVTASAIVGGISGDNDGTTNQSVYDNCHNTGALRSHFAAGGIIGRYNTYSFPFGGNDVTTSPVIRNCSNRGNIVLEDGSFTFTIAEFTVECLGNAGGIAGLLSEVDIENCTNYGNVTANARDVGGIVAKAESLNISDCLNEGTVTANFTQGYVGGICGNNRYGRIENCTNNGTVNTPAQAVSSVNLGGICGLIQGTNNHGVFSCENNGSVSCADNVGGIVSAAIGVTISDCTNYGEISGLYEYTGATSGIVCCSNRNEVDGTDYMCVITNCVNSGSVNSGPSEGAVAGILAECDEANIQNCVNTADLIGHLVVAGIAGAGEQFTVTNCYNVGNLTSDRLAAGVAGYCEDFTVTNCHNEGMVQVVDYHEATLNDLFDISTGAGGVVGMANNGTISSCYNIGNVSGGVRTAGVVGFIDSNEEAVTNCFNLGAIEGYLGLGFTGGIVGNFSVADGVGTTKGIKNCYNAGPVKGYGMAGGIAAYCETNVSDCYNIGYVECSEVSVSDGSNTYNFNYALAVLGGLVTDNITPVATNCYYDKQMCPLENDYMTFALSDITAVTPHASQGNNMLTTAMVGSGMNSSFDAATWTFADGLYPQLTAYAASSNGTDVESSLVSTTPMFLANEETVDQVLTSPFKVGTDNDLEWIRVGGNNLLSFNGSEVTWSGSGTETVAVRHTTDTQIQKLIKVRMIPSPIADGFWPDVVTTMPTTGYVTDASGNVTISSAEGLAWLISVVNGYNGQTADNLQGKTVTLDASVTYEMSDHYWVPIGTDATNYFAGTILTTGGQVTIDGILLPEAGINRTSIVNSSVTFNTGAECDNQGLFGYANDAQFNNITIGSNSTVLGDKYVGGICGNAQVSDFIYCVNNGSITGVDYIGGIAGNVIGTDEDHCLVNNCSNNGNINGLGIEPGGIIGHVTLGELESCYNTGNVSIIGVQGLSDGFAAGISGSFYNSHANNCYNTGTINSGSVLSGGQCASGVIGDSSHNSSYAFDNSITNCYNTGEIVGPIATGIVGLCEDGPTTVENCYNTGSITGELYASGIAAMATNHATVSSCYNTGDITTIGVEINKKEEALVCLAAGIVAYSDQSTITDCNNSGAVSFNNTSFVANVAGICATMSNESSVTKCHNSGSIMANGKFDTEKKVIAGGIVADDGEQNRAISYCSNDGNVTSNYFAGGIWGDMGGGVFNSYNTGTIRGILAGGISALAENDDERVINCFNTGNIIGVPGDESPFGFSMAGGIIGECIESGTLTNCYNTGMIVAYGIAGGLTGFAEHDCAENCYNAGQVTCYPVQAEMETGSGEFTTFQYEGGLFAGMVDEPIAAVTHCYYDKQMCTQANAYTVMSEGGKGRDNTVGSFLTTDMLGYNMRSLFGTEAWTYEDGLYPRLTVFDSIEYFPNNDASITSVSPVHLVYTDGTTYQDVDNVTSSFTLRYGDMGNEDTHPVYWEHDGNGSSLYTAQINYGQVGISATGNDTLVAMKNGMVYKTVVFHTVRAAGETWVDVVVAQPDGYDDLDIDSPEDLAWFCSRVNGFNGETAKPYLNGTITADIDLSAHCWVPIGFDYPDVNSNIEVYYTGSFNGNYHNIDGINIDYQSLKASPVLNSVGGSKENRDHRDNIGFFGGTENASIKNVILASGTISGYTEENNTNYMGGMVGFMMVGQIKNCVSNLTLTRSNYEVRMGGLVGRCDGGKILNCTSLATLEANQGMIGGLLGTEELTLISNCYSNAKFNVQSIDKGDKSTYVGGLFGSLGKGQSGDAVNCYVLLRDDSEYGLPTKDDKDGGSGDPHLFGLFAAATYNGSFSHCYAPEGTGYPYVAEAAEVRFVKATSDDFLSFSKEHNYTYTQIATAAGGNQYHIMPWNLNAAFLSLTGSTQQGVNSVEFLSDSYNEGEQFRIDIRSANDNTNHYGIRHKEGEEYDLGYDDGMLVGNVSAPNPTWDIEQFPGENAFKVSNYPYSDICLALHDNGNGTYTFGAYSYTAYGSDPAYDFHINFFTETEISSDGNLYGCGTFSAPSYPYTYTDPRGGNIVTLDNADENDYVTSGKTTLLDALNNWVVGNYVGTPELFNTYAPDPDWARFGSALNGDYPVHCYYDPDNIKPADETAQEGGDLYSPTAKVVVTTDKAKGYPFRYYHHVSDALAYCNAQSNGGILCVYGSDDMRNADTQENDANVDVYVNGMTYMQCDTLKSGEPYSYYTFFGDNAATNSTDWYVSLLQDENKHLTVTTGFNLDNSDATDFAGANYDWHMVSSPLTQIPVGIVYSDNSQHGLSDLPECSWDNTADGLFPDDTPYSSFDFYAYSEPYYHWMNFKRNSNSHWFQDTGAHIDDYENDEILVPGHGYLIALDKELFMQAKGELNNGDVEVEVTYSGAHNKGLNYLGNPYQSSLDFDAFVTENSLLWQTEGNNYYQSYLILDADAHCYKYYVQTQSDNPELPSRYIWPFQGFYVGVDTEGEARFTNDMRVIGVNHASYMHKDESVQNAYPLVNLTVTDNEGKSDMFTVELGRPEWGGGHKEKEMTAGSGMLWSRHDDKEYSVLFSGTDVDEIPVRFSAKNSGVFTMTWSHYNGEFSYLHLIDNMTGADIDCLSTDSYSFEGKTEDYQSRFKLVFDYTGVEENDEPASTTNFAFLMGDELVVNGEGALQMFDVNGRCLMGTELYGQQNTINLPKTAPGVYVLRLTSGSQVKMQKMVVR